MPDAQFLHSHQQAYSQAHNRYDYDIVVTVLNEPVAASAGKSLEI